MTTPSPTLLPHIGYVTIAETYVDILGLPVSGLRVDFAAAALYGTDEDSATITGGAVSGVVTAYTNASGVLMKDNGSGAASSTPVTWPISNSPYVDQTILITVSEWF